MAAGGVGTPISASPTNNSLVDTSNNNATAVLVDRGFKPAVLSTVPVNASNVSSNASLDNGASNVINGVTLAGIASRPISTSGLVSAAAAVTLSSTSGNGVTAIATGEPEAKRMRLDTAQAEPGLV